jgi:hypothetical protein
LVSTHTRGATYGKLVMCLESYKSSIAQR